MLRDVAHSHVHPPPVWKRLAPAPTPHLRTRTRRALLALATLGAGCAPPWQRPDPAPILAEPAPTPVRFGPVRLRLVLGTEALAPLDQEVRTGIERAARGLGFSVDFFDADTFAGGADGSARGALGQRLLAAVQAGVPPDGLLLPGRRAQTKRWQALGLLHDVSHLMRDTRARLGGVAEVAERRHLVAGSWYAVPFYQRLVGHWVHPDAFALAGVDPAGFSLAALATLAPELGIGAADTEDVDGWVWNVVHAWGGVLTDNAGQRVTLASPETEAALNSLKALLRDAAPAALDDLSDAEKNGAFVSGRSVYTYTERALPPDAFGPDGALLVPPPRGPEGAPHAPRAVNGGAVWLLPRGARAEPLERMWEALLQPASQRALWTAGGGFALPAYESGWSDATIAALPGRESIRRYRDQLAPAQFISHAGQLGPVTAASEAVEAGRLGARLLRAVRHGVDVRHAINASHAAAVSLFKQHGLPGV